MHARFARARRADLRCPGGAVQAVAAEGLRLRLLGLMRLRAPDFEAILFLNCRSIHTYGMRAAIDLVWIAFEGDRGTVLKVVAALEPRCHSRAPRGGVRARGIAALELAGGQAARLGLTAGATVELV